MIILGIGLLFLIISFAYEENQYVKKIEKLENKLADYELKEKIAEAIEKEKKINYKKKWRSLL